MTTHMHVGTGSPFGMTHTADQVADALRGYFAREDLAQLARLVRKTGDRRNRRRKDSGRLHPLADILTQASRLPAITAPIQVFDRHAGGEPLEVLLSSGERTAIVPAGATFTVPEHDGGQLFLRPAGTGGPDGLVLTGARAGAVVSIADEPSGGINVQMVNPTPIDAY